MNRHPYPFAGGALRNFIDGRFVEGPTRFPNLDPVTGARLADVTAADRAMVDRAVAAARAALKGDWGRMAQDERCRLLVRVAEGIEARFDDFVAAEVADTGKPLAHARAVDIPRGAANFRSFAALAEARKEARLSTLREVLGVARGYASTTNPDDWHQGYACAGDRIASCIEQRILALTTAAGDG